MACRKKSSGEALCLLVTQPPSQELARFRKKWQATTKLPFPDNILPISRTTDAYAAITKAEAQLPGYVIGFVTESRPFNRPPSPNDPLQSYDASVYDLPVIFAAHQEPNTLPSPSLGGKLPPERPEVEVDQVLLKNFQSRPILNQDFTVPPGFAPQTPPAGL